MADPQLPDAPLPATHTIRIIKNGPVPTPLRWQLYDDAWRNTVRDLRWYGACIVCGRNVWAFDDGENDPRGVLGDNALWSIGEDHEPTRTCAVCANEEGSYRMALEMVRQRGSASTRPIVWARKSSEGTPG